MSAIKSKGTAIEVSLGKAMWKLGIRYRKNNNKIIGKPDFSIKKHKIAIFCDSEFFHGKDWVNQRKRLDTNREFWIKKIEKNIERDDFVNKELQKDGWRVLRFWGSNIKKNPVDCAKIVKKAIEENKLKKNKKKFTYISLFSGAGGLEEGFLNYGFSPIAHVEENTNACYTLKTRLTYHYLKKNKKLNLYYDYLKGEISRNDLYDFLPKYLQNSIINLPIGDRNNREIFKRIDKQLVSLSEIDLLIGGPPCQAYSLIGRSVDKNKMKNDPRNYLYKHYGRYLKRYQPKMFIFENVLGLRSAENGNYLKNMKAYFRRIGYVLDEKLHNASDYGVLQNRKRLILIGWKKGLNYKYPALEKINNYFTVNNILNDLPELQQGEGKSLSKYVSRADNYLLRFNLRSAESFVTQHQARPNQKRDLNIYKIAVKKWLNNNERLKYPDLPAELKTHQNEKSFVDRFKVVDIKKFSHTLVAHISKDGHHYIYPSLNQIRSLTVREAARIQSFADNYYFEGGRTSSFKQIGNAVPPLLSEAIAFKIKEFFVNE